jgi:hypothetical protein
MRKPAAAVLLFAIVVCVALRTMHGWALVGHVTDPNKSFPYGMVGNRSDYLSYSSWALQARHGAWTFSDLYTTTPHAAIYFNPFFLAAGWLSRAFSVQLELVLNLSVFLSLFIFVFSLDAACRQLRFGGLTTFCVLCLCFGGGGVTWLRRIVDVLGLRSALRFVGPADTIWGYPDWFFGELFPAITFNASPYHSMSLALIALLAAWLIRYDEPAERLSAWRAAALIGVAAFLVGLRPYEPVVLLAAYAAYLPCTLFDRSERLTSAIKRRCWLFSCLLVGIAPVLVYDFWVTRQPVWHEFSQKGLDLIGASDWAGALLVLWVLAIASVVILGRRALRGPYALLVVWSSIIATLLVILHSGLTKLCGGCTIPLALLAGVAIEQGLAQLRSSRQRALAALVLACLALGSSTAVVMRLAKFPADRVSGELLAAMDAIRRDSKLPIPAVLTDTETAMYLPGLGGLRVYCGNWGLTDDFWPKCASLAAVGLGSSGPPYQPPDDPEESRAIRAAMANLWQQIQQNTFACILIHEGYASPQLEAFEGEMKRRFPQSIIYRGKAYCAVKLDRDTIDNLSLAIGSAIRPKKIDGTRGQVEKR